MKYICAYKEEKVGSRRCFRFRHGGRCPSHRLRSNHSLPVRKFEHHVQLQPFLSSTPPAGNTVCLVRILEVRTTARRRSARLWQYPVCNYPEKAVRNVTLSTRPLSWRTWASFDVFVFGIFHLCNISCWHFRKILSASNIDPHVAGRWIENGVSGIQLGQRRIVVNLQLPIAYLGETDIASLSCKFLSKMGYCFRCWAPSDGELIVVFT